MANDLVIQGGKAAIPAHIAKRYAGQASDIMDTSISLPSLLVTGKVFTVSMGSQRIKITKKDEDGDEVPRASLPVVILDYAKTRGRAYFAGAYDPDSTGAPDCFSIDGITPDPNAPDVQAPKCAGCPMAIKGSRVTDNNKQVAACSEQRLLALVPANKLDGSFPVLRLKLAVTSDYDGQSKDMEAKGHFAFQNYLAFLKQAGVTTLRTVVTSISFDANAAYPKLFFKAKGWLDEAECGQADTLKDDPGVAAILGDTAVMPEGGRAPRLAPPTKPAENKPAAAAEKQPTKKQRETAEKKAAESKPAAAAKPEEVAGGLSAEEQAMMDRLLAKQKGAIGTAAPAPAAADTLSVGGDDDDDKPTAETAPAAEKSTRKPEEPVAAKVTPDVAAVLGDWE